MGGSAFTIGNDPLFTPRMPKNVYLAVKAQCQAALREHYLCVASPIDGPGKKDFGDVDILVTWPKGTLSDKKDILHMIGESLEATRIIDDKGNGIAGHFAIPWPSPRANDEASPHEALDDAGQTRHIQVDVRVCNTIEHFHWMLFKHAHGDIWNLLGSTIRPYGLSIDETALWLRVPEIENSNRKLAKIWLTDEPPQILLFLGLDVTGYWTEPFESLEAMYEYVAKCRLFHVEPCRKEDDPSLTENERDRLKLKANDRKRMAQRPGFRKWVDEFKPQCRAQGRFSTNSTTREQVTREAFAVFNVKGQYDARRDEFLRWEQRNSILTHSIKGAIPGADPHNNRAIVYRSCLIKALKGIILDGASQYGEFPVGRLRGENGLFVEEEVDKFVERHKEEIGKAAMAIHDANYVEFRQRKAAKAVAKAAKAGEATATS